MQGKSRRVKQGERREKEYYGSVKESESERGLLKGSKVRYMVEEGRTRETEGQSGSSKSFKVI